MRAFVTGPARIGRDGRSPAAEVVGRGRSPSEMNAEETMFVAYDVALELVRALRPVVAQLRRYSPEAADQVERAASSIVLNLAEGRRRRGRDPRRFWDMAHGSAGEIRGALDLADAWGWEVDSARARALLDRELGLLWGLTRRSSAKDALPPASGSRTRPR
jgi:four helix bundle protein